MIDRWARISLLSRARVTGGDLLACLFYMEILTCDRVHYCRTAGLNMPCHGVRLLWRLQILQG